MSTIVFITTGPRLEHRQGVADILDALAVYEPATQKVIVICDGPLADIEPIAAASTIPVELLPHPRAGRGTPLRGGGCVARLAELQRVAAEVPDLAVHLDSDALIIGPSFARLRQYLDTNPSVGVVGAYRDGPRVTHVRRSARRLMLPVAIWRDPDPGYRHLAQLLRGPNAQVRRWLLRARDAGWDIGAHCQGGAVAVSSALAVAARNAGLLERPLDWLSMPLAGDVMLSALAIALGFEVADFSGPGEPFAVDYGRLPASPPELVKQGHSLIHSLNSDPLGSSRTELRAYFAARRAAVGKSQRGFRI